MNEDRIIELEIKAAYQEDLLQELNRIVGQQQQQIDRLEATCLLLNERIKSLSTEGSGGESVIARDGVYAASQPGAGAADEVPPHY